MDIAEGRKGGSVILPNTINHGDCLDIMQDIADKSIDLILCDLPYGTTACKWDTIIPFEPLWEQYKRIIKDNGAIVLTASQPFTSMLVMSNLKMFRYQYVWIKPQGVDPFMAKHRPLNNVEDVLMFSNGKEQYNPQLEKGQAYRCVRDKKERIKETNDALMKRTITRNNGTRLPTRTLHYAQEKGAHPTQKPVALFEHFIKTYTDKCDIVLDNCAGSGTTGVACINTNRKYILIEKEQQYIEICKERTAQKHKPLTEFGMEFCNEKDG